MAYGIFYASEGDKKMKSKILVKLSLALAILASIFMTFLGATQGLMSVSEVGVGQGAGEMIIERVGAFHPILIVFILFPLLGLIGINRKNKIILWIAAVGMFLLSILSLLSFGLVFLPAVIMLLGAAIFYRKEAEDW